MGEAEGVGEGAQRAQQAEAGSEEPRQQAAAPGQREQEAGDVLGPCGSRGLLQLLKRLLQAVDLHLSGGWLREVQAEPVAGSGVGLQAGACT